LLLFFDALNRTVRSVRVRRSPGESDSSNWTVCEVLGLFTLWTKSLSIGLSISSSIVEEQVVATEPVLQATDKLFCQAPALALSALGTRVAVAAAVSPRRKARIIAAIATTSSKPAPTFIGTNSNRRILHPRYYPHPVY